MTASGHGRARLPTVLLATLGGILLLAGPARADAEDPGFENNPAQIVGGEISPAYLTYEGGNAQIRADVTDDVGVSTVYAQIYGPNGPAQNFQLFNGGGDSYYGTLEVAPNSSNESVNYEVEIQVYDTDNAYSASLIGGVQLEGAPRFEEHEEEPGFDNPPEIHSFEASPWTLPHEGGQVQFRAEVTDDLGIASVWAQVYGPDGAIQAIQLFYSGGNSYIGEMAVAPNFSDSQFNYGVEIQATDSGGNFDSELVGGFDIEPAPQFDEFPSVNQVSVTPQLLPAAGGPVTIKAEASDNHSVASVFATIALPGGGFDEIPMNAVDFGQFEGTYVVPANSGPLPAQYGIEVSAQDDAGQEARVSGGTVAVEAPPQISTGRLVFRPKTVRFGAVRVGKRVARTVVLTNKGRRGTGAIEGTASVSGSSSFSLPGSSVPVNIEPGASKAIQVWFMPAVAGRQTAALTLVRADGNQPGLAASLTGRGLSSPEPPRRR